MTPGAGDVFGAEALVRLRQRAEQAAAAGANTFDLPEAAPVAELVAAMARERRLRTEAERWLADGASYHAIVRLAARAVTELGGDTAAADAVYVPKAAAELEPILRLWPAVIALPTTIAFEPLDLVSDHPSRGRRQDRLDPVGPSPAAPATGPAPHRLRHEPGRSARPGGRASPVRSDL